MSFRGNGVINGIYANIKRNETAQAMQVRVITAAEFRLWESKVNKLLCFLEIEIEQKKDKMVGR